MTGIEQLTADDVELMVSVLEDVIKSRVTVKEIMKKHGISYEDYTKLSDLAMPFIRANHDYLYGKKVDNHEKR